MMKDKKLLAEVGVNDYGDVFVTFSGPTDMLYVLNRVLDDLKVYAEKRYESGKLAGLKVFEKDLGRVLERFAGAWKKHVEDVERRKNDVKGLLLAYSEFVKVLGLSLD